MLTWTLKPIGFVHSRFSEANQVPRGLGAKHEDAGVLEVLPEFESGLKDIEGFSHLFVLWVFDRSRGYELVGTPPCDTQPHGVFATRSPLRPNPIGLTVVRFLRRDGNQLHVQGVDMVDGTPILDIKPYLSNVPDSELKRGWLAQAEARREAQGHGQGPL
jgi:tRNA-Thr(GGU) m(6)t(6)A37 methyltransferase TsaA